MRNGSGSTLVDIMAPRAVAGIPRLTHRTAPPRQAGYTLLEILIAVVVLAIGLLGVAGLQTTSLQNNQSAGQVSQATFLAMDIFERMRANAEEARNGNYDLDFGGSSDDDQGGSLASTDQRQWLEQVEAAIPGTQGSSCGTGNSECGASITVDDDGRARVIIRWVDERRDGEQHNTSFTTESRI